MKSKITFSIITILILVTAVMIGVLKEENEKTGEIKLLGKTIKKGTWNTNFEVETSKTYNEQDKTITIKDEQNQQIATIRLNTPLIHKVMRGANRKVAEFTITTEDSYNEPLERVEFYNTKRNMRQENRKFIYKYKVVTETQEPNYETTEEQVWVEANANGTKARNITITTRTQAGTRTGQKEEWLDFNEKTIMQKGEITVGVFTDVRPNDRIEFIPVYFGQYIDEWAVWEESLTVGLLAWYNFDEEAGEALPEATGQESNSTIGGTANWTIGDGLLGNALTFDGSDDYVTTTICDGGLGSGDSSHAITFWLRSDLQASPTYDQILYKSDASTYSEVDMNQDNDNLTGVAYTATGGATMTVKSTALQDVWEHHVLVYNGTALIIYRNGELVGSSVKGDPIDRGADCLGFGRRTVGTPDRFYKGGMDEMGLYNRTLTPTEVSNLYNSGTGITFTSNYAPSTPTWNAPSTNDTKIMSNSYYVNWTNSTDANGDTLTYLVDIATDDAFATIVQSNSSISETATPTGMWVTGLANGTYYARVRANDGTVNSSWTSTYWEQTSNTSVTLNIPADNTNSTVASITFNCSAYDPDDKLATLSLIIDDTVNYTKTESNNNLTIQRNITLTGSSHTWTCNATNSEDETATQTKRTIIIDPSEVELYEPTDAVNSTTSNVRFSCTGNGTANIKNITLKIDGIVNYTHAGTGLVKETLNTTVALTGKSHNWSCISYDVNEFNATTTTRTFTIDNMDLTQVIPTATHYSSSTVDFNCTVGSRDNIETIRLLIDGTINETSTETTTNATLRTNVTLTAGSHNFACNATSTTGQTEQTGNITFTNQNTLNLTATVQLPTMLTDTGTMNITCTATNSEGLAQANTTRVENTVDGVTWNDTSTRYTFNKTDFQDELQVGCYACTVYQCDHSENVTISNDTINTLFTFNAHGWAGLLTNANWTFQNKSYNLASNPLSLLATHIINRTDKNRDESVLIKDLSYQHRDLTQVRNINETVTAYNFSLSENQLILRFVYLNESTKQTEGYISTGNKTILFVNATMLSVQQSLGQSRIYVRFGTTLGDNWTQYYEYKNELTTHIDETVSLLDRTDWSAVVKVVDYTNSPIQDTTIRVYQGYNNNESTAWRNFTLMGQRLSDQDGFASFVADSRTELRIIAIKDGYDTVQTLATIGDESYTRDDPLLIYLQESETGSKEGTQLYVVGDITNETTTILGNILSTASSTVKIQTTYRQTLGLSQVELSKNNLDQWGFTLTAGVDYGILNPNLTLLIYTDDNLWDTKVIEIQQIADTEILGTTIPSWALLIAIIVITLGIGVGFSNTNAGTWAFLGSTAMAGLLNTKFLVLTLIGIGAYITLKIMRKVITE